MQYYHKIKMKFIMNKISNCQMIAKSNQLWQQILNYKVYDSKELMKVK